MKEILTFHPDLQVQEKEYARLLGFPPGYSMEGRVRELADQTVEAYREQGDPWSYARMTQNIDWETNPLMIENRTFAAQALRERCRSTKAQGLVLAFVTAGHYPQEAAHEFWLEGKPDEYFFMETYASAVVERLIAEMSLRLCGWAEEHQCAVLPHDSPGYVSWDIAEQNALWAIIQGTSSKAFPEPVQLLPSGMINPKKSLLAVFPITHDLDTARSLQSLIPCHRCSLPNCQYRRAPYRMPLPQLECIRPRATASSQSPVEKPKPRRVLDSNAQYATSVRALKKWVQQRLQLNFHPDGSIDACFQFEGTTCMDLGHPLLFDYHVNLDTPENKYRIRETYCVPSTMDTGYHKMCQTLNDPIGMEASLRENIPMVGRPLNDVLQWRREFNPSGCLCDSPSRDHKWGLVLEALHYALVQRQSS